MNLISQKKLREKYKISFHKVQKLEKAKILKRVKFDFDYDKKSVYYYKNKVEEAMKYLVEGE